MSTVPAVLLAVWGEETVFHLPWLLFGTHIGLDGIGRVFVVVAGLLYTGALCGLCWGRRSETKPLRGALTGFLLVTFIGSIGTFMAADTWTFYLMFSLMSFAAAGLVIHHRTAQSHRATLLYLVVSVVSETAVLAAVLLITGEGAHLVANAPVAVAGSPLAGPIVALLLLGFGIKAGLAPMHLWMPLAYTAAPAAGSAVLSGIMAKAGVIGWLRFMPLGETAADSPTASTVELLGWLMLVLALVGALIAPLVGVLQKNPQTIIAYSSISQLGLIGAVIAVGLIDPSLAPATSAAAVLYAAHHALTKGALFLGVPVIRHSGRGVLAVLPFIGLGLVGLSLAGAPFTSGSMAKYGSKESAGLELWVSSVDHLLPLVATGSTILLLRLSVVLWKAQREPGRVNAQQISFLAVCAAATVVPWWVGSTWSPLKLPEWDGMTLWNAIWPILVGLLLAAGVWALARRERIPGRLRAADGDLVPAGDLAVPAEAAYRQLVTVGESWVQQTKVVAETAGQRVQMAARAASKPLTEGVTSLEESLKPWHRSGLAILTVLVVVVLAAVLLMLNTSGGG